jgi:hypothetical protein
MLGNFFKKLDYHKELNEIREKLGKTDTKTQKSCNGCSFCCWQKPCNLSKEDIGIMAKHFEITPQELFKKYLVVDDAGAKDGEFTLTPIRKEWQKYAGKYLPSDATFDLNTPCVFLNEVDKKCVLHGLAKPAGGRDLECWKEKQYVIESFTKEELAKEVGWDGDTDEFGWDDDN